MAEEFLEGASSVVMGALVVGFAKAILVILQGAMIIDTIVFYASQVLQGMPPIIAAQGMLILQTLINFFIPSSTGQAATVIPILAPLGDLLGVSRQVTCLAFQFGDGFPIFCGPHVPLPFPSVSAEFQCTSGGSFSCRCSASYILHRH